MSRDVHEVAALVSSEAELIASLRSEIGKSIIGQQQLVDRLILALLCNNHVLIEGVPGLAKTLTVTSLAKAIQARFSRIQFTPDLLPADVIGTLIYNPKTAEFTTRKGPIFANIVLADEINRAPAKVQSALLEAMQERQVTIGEKSYLLEEPFLVLATQNPIEQEGTYPLPEAQVDRFIFKLRVSYPKRDDELQILRRMATSNPKSEIQAIINPSDIQRLRSVLDRIYIDPKLEEYIVSIVEATRDPQAYNIPVADLIRYGASPRASIFLALAAKGNAFLGGRGYVRPQDIKDVAMDVLRHRVAITYEAEAEEKTSEEIVRQILDGVEVP